MCCKIVNRLTVILPAEYSQDICRVTRQHATIWCQKWDFLYSGTGNTRQFGVRSGIFFTLGQVTRDNLVSEVRFSLLWDR
jgi:hypothetical protein